LLTGAARDHGGGVDDAATRFGGRRIDWIDLSTGINPVPYSVPALSGESWTALPDRDALDTLTTAARRFWAVPKGADVLAAPGASALIALLPALRQQGRVTIPEPTYNEHAGAFESWGWRIQPDGPADAQVIVHPNNPDGKIWTRKSLPVDAASLTVIDESFCDVCPEHSLIEMANLPGVIVLKSFGKFWGLAGLRLGFAIGDPVLLDRLRRMQGPWAVSGPALHIGAKALADEDWATVTRQRLAVDSARLDDLLTRSDARRLGGTTLFRLFEVEDAAHWQERLAHSQIWSRIFPYNARWLRLGLPAPSEWSRLEAALI
jgi:cobalamin biosynthetic protein CobC